MFVALLLQAFPAPPEKLFVLRESARQFLIQSPLRDFPHRFGLFHDAGPALIEILSPAFSLVADTFVFLVIMGFRGVLRGTEQNARSADCSRHGPGRASGHKPSEGMKNENSAEAPCQGDARLLPGESLDTETRERQHDCGMASHQQQNQQPRRKQTEEKRQRRYAKPAERPLRLREQSAEFLRQTVYVVVDVHSGRLWRGVEQASERRVSAKSVPGPALQFEQHLPLAGQIILEVRESNVGPFLFRFLIAAGVQQLALDVVDLPSFTTLDHLQMVVPGRGLGAMQLGFAPIIVGFESFLAGLQQSIQPGDRAGKSGFQVLNFLADLAVESGGVQVQFPRELIGAVGASPNGAFEAVQKFKRFLQTQMATHNRSSRYV